LGQHYRRYRLADPLAEEVMAGSLRRWGQLAPVVACAREAQLELLDGFKRFVAAGQVGLSTLSVRVLEVDERTAKAAILGLNHGQHGTRELEEAWIVQALVREDALTQVEAARLTTALYGALGCLAFRRVAAHLKDNPDGVRAVGEHVIIPLLGRKLPQEIEKARMEAKKVRSRLV